MPFVCYYVCDAVTTHLMWLLYLKEICNLCQVKSYQIVLWFTIVDGVTDELTGTGSTNVKSDSYNLSQMNQQSILCPRLNKRELPSTRQEK